MNFDATIEAVRGWLLRYVIDPLVDFWSALGPGDRVVLYVLLGITCLVGVWLGRRRSPHRPSGRWSRRFQNEGESLVTRALRREFGPPNYHLMNHVTLPVASGTTQIDHILVSRFGVFVVETKHYKGWLFGSAAGQKWTQVLFKSRFSFQNPLHQNEGHARAVKALLDFLPAGAVRPVVVFTGSAEFKTEIPKGVVRLAELPGYIRMQAEEVMSSEQLELSVGRLETTRLAISAKTDVEHVENLKRRLAGAPHN